MELDKYGIPSSPYFSSRYMEAKVKEDIKLLNVITENYRFNCITENAALALIEIVRKDEGDLIDDLEVYESFSDLEVPVSNRVVYVGESVIPFTKIVSESTDLTIYRPYTFGREWSDQRGLVYEMATIVADEKMDNLKEFIESRGLSGFDITTRSVYAALPEREDRKYLFEKVLDGKVLAGNLSPEDGSIAKGLVSHMFTENDVAEMAPVTTQNQPTITKNIPDMKETFKKDMEYMKADDKNKENTNEPDLKTLKGVFEYVSAMLRDENFFVSLEEAKGEDNPLLDKDARKIFMSISKMVKMSDPKDIQKSLMDCLSSDKLSYRFNLMKDVNIMVVLNTVKTLGYKLNENESKKNDYILHRDVKSGVLTAEVKKRYVEISWEGTDEDSVKESTEKDPNTKKKTQAESLIDECINHKDIAVRDAAKKAKKLMMTGSDEAEIKKAVNAFLHIYKTYEKVQVHKTFKEHVGESQMFSAIIETQRAMEDERNTNLFISFESLSDMKELLMSASELISESVQENIDNVRCRIVSSDVPGFYKHTPLPEYLINTMMESPSRMVAREASNLLEKVYSENASDLSTAVDRFMEAVRRQDAIEHIAEIVLNQSNFQRETYQEYFAESEKDIDDGIKPIVEKLNKLGYKVKYSCAGHSRSHVKEDRFRDGVYEGKLYSTARIVFDKRYGFSGAPDGWYFNKNADVSAMYVRPYQYAEKDGTPEESFNKWKARYMRSLESWVDNLNDTSQTDPSKKVMNMAESFYESVKVTQPYTRVESKDIPQDTVTIADIAESSFRRFGIN